MSKILRFSFAALLVFAMCAVGFGQGTVTGAIGGVVTNPNKEVVPGASVTVKNTGTNKEDTVTTDDQGRFRVANLEPGTYSVTINASGFSAYNQERVIVEVGTVTPINADLSVGPVQGGTVEITSEAPVINTQQQDFANNVNQTQINNLPINGSRWSNFALLNPGTVPDGNFGLISFRGISGLLNNSTIDGGDNNQAFFSEEKGRTRLSYTVSQSAVREFQVNTSNYSAEYGRAAGGVVNAVTKSGTNQWHGSADYYQRNNKWGARNPLGFLSTFNPATGTSTRAAFKPEDVRHTIRGTIGGPIKKDKLFFFFSYDEQRRRFPGLGIFSTDGFLATVNQCIGPVDPTGGPNHDQCTTTALLGTSLRKPATNLTPTQINSAISFLTSLTGPVPRTGNQRIFLPKVDWRINQDHTFTASYNRLRWDSPAGIQTQPTNTLARRSFGDDFVDVDTINLRLSSTFGANMVNELRYQWGRDNEYEFSQEPLPGEPLTSPAYPGVTTAGTRGPEVFITGGISFGTPNFLERTKFPFETRKQIADTVTLTAGNHTIKWGGDFNNIRDEQDNLRLFAGGYSYNNINDFIIDYTNFATSGGLGASVACSTSARLRGKCYTSNYTQGFGPTQFAFTTQDINVFLQDEWRYTPRLTVNLGVRYEYERLPKPFLPSSVPQTNNFPKDKNNIGPRIGFAWDVSGDGKNSLRGGYGIYYGRIINSTILNALTNTGNAGGQFQSSTPQATGPIFPNVLPSAPAGTAAIQFFQHHFQAPLIHQMDVVYEREIARNTVISGSVLISIGRNLPTFVDTNLAQPVGAPFNVTAGANTFTVNPKYTITNGPFAGQTYTIPLFTGVRPISAFGAMTEIRSTVSSRYYGFVAQLNRRLTNGLQFQANYTRSRSHDTGQGSQTFTATNSPFNSFSPFEEEGISNFDIPNKFSVNAVYAPHFKVSGGADKILNGWQLSPIVTAYSGVPFTPTISGSFPTACPNAATTLPAPCTSNAGVSVAGPTVGTQAGGQNGSGGSTRFNLVPRNSYRLPKIVNFDMRLSRRFKFNESTALEVLAEGFNLFNRTQVTGVNSALYATGGTYKDPILTVTNNFGTTSAAGGTLFRERQVQLGVRFQF